MALQLLKDGKTFADINSEEPKIEFITDLEANTQPLVLGSNLVEFLDIIYLARLEAINWH